jgi:hypothetical protein
VSFLRVSASLRDLAFVIALWSSCFTEPRVVGLALPVRCSVVVAWASALVVTHKMGCLRCISAVATREILDFRLAKRKRPYPPVVVNKCCGCKFKDEFGNSHPRIQEDLQDLIAGHGG